ncbi:hypothetical protein ACFY36_09300 [Actinoplanes sp. NPDC000266]
MLALGHVARAVGGDTRPEVIHPAVVEAMRLIEGRPAHPWTLTELAELLHLAPGYVVRLFKSVTGLPPMAPTTSGGGSGRTTGCPRPSTGPGSRRATSSGAL